MPVAVKTVTAVVLAARVEDWREAFRTKPDEYQAYQADQERRRSRVSVGISAGNGSRGPR